MDGITARTLPMTRSESSELFVDDLAVRVDHRRRGVATALVHELRAAAAAAGVGEVFVPADDDDQHALEPYRSRGAGGEALTIFTFPELPLP